jgi:hypothetical protein
MRRIARDGEAEGEPCDQREEHDEAQAAEADDQRLTERRPGEPEVSDHERCQGECDGENRVHRGTSVPGALCILSV